MRSKLFTTGLVLALGAGCAFNALAQVKQNDYALRRCAKSTDSFDPKPHSRRTHECKQRR